MTSSNRPTAEWPPIVLFPGRPGESLADFLARSTAEFERAMIAAEARGRPLDVPPVGREERIMGMPRRGRGWGS